MQARNVEGGDTATARAQAQAHGRELLTPSATAGLFGVTPAAVRQARIRGRVESPFSLEVAGRPADLLTLESAVRFWRKALVNPDTLDRMRSNGLLITVRGKIFNVLHPRPMLLER